MPEKPDPYYDAVVQSNVEKILLRDKAAQYDEKSQLLGAVIAECERVIAKEKPSYEYGYTAATNAAKRILKIAKGEIR